MACQYLLSSSSILFPLPHNHLLHIVVWDCCIPLWLTLFRLSTMMSSLHSLTSLHELRIASW